VLLVVIPLLAAVIGLCIYLQGGRHVETDNAYVKADKVPVSAEVSGAVIEVFVQENQEVQAGQALFRLDPKPFQLAVSRAEARLYQERTNLLALKASYREKVTEISMARTRLTFANRDRQRQADLAADHVISVVRLDESTQQAELAAQQVTALEQDLKRIAESLGGNDQTPLEQHPAYLAALAEVEQARLDLARVIVHAPVAGTVGKPPKRGQYLNAGATALALVVSGDPWIEANFPEADLTYVHPGQPVVIHIDTYPGITWRGIVDSLSPATGAEFSVLPAQNATGNWVKIAQRVPIRIKLDPGVRHSQLRAGLSATVDIDTGHQRRLFGFAL